MSSGTNTSFIQHHSIGVADVAGIMYPFSSATKSQFLSWIVDGADLVHLGLLFTFFTGFWIDTGVSVCLDLFFDVPMYYGLGIKC